MKILKSSQISPFGGLNFVINEFDQLGLSTLLENNLPPLAQQTSYS